MAVAQASSYSSNLTPKLGTSICGPKKTKKKKKNPTAAEVQVQSAAGTVG